MASPVGERGRPRYQGIDIFEAALFVRSRRGDGIARPELHSAAIK
jgi:hypothetical protein